MPLAPPEWDLHGEGLGGLVNLDLVAAYHGEGDFGRGPNGGEQVVGHTSQLRALAAARIPASLDEWAADNEAANFLGIPVL